MIGMNIARNPSIILVGAFYYSLYLGCNEFCESANKIYNNNKSTYFNY